MTRERITQTIHALTAAVRTLLRCHARGGALPKPRARDGEHMIRLSPGRGLCPVHGCDWEPEGDEAAYIMTEPTSAQAFDQETAEHYAADPAALVRAVVDLEAAVYRNRRGLADRLADLERRFLNLSYYCEQVEEDLDQGLPDEEKRARRRSRQVRAEQRQTNEDRVGGILPW